MARTTQKTRTQQVRHRVTRDLAPAKNGKAPKGGATSPTPPGGILVVMGDGSVRMGDGSVKTIKPSI